MRLVIKTNIPAIIVDLWDGYYRVVGRRHAESKLMPYFQTGASEPTEDEGEVVFDDLERGLYAIRISLPYYNEGEKFEMPVVMDKLIRLDEAVKIINFKASING